MAKDPMMTFEIAPEIRKFAEQSVEEARKAFDCFITAAQSAANDIEERANSAQAGVKDVGERAMTFAERNVTSSFEFAQKLVRAKDTEEIMKLQADYVQSQIKTLNDQAKEIGSMASRAAMRAANR